MQPMVLVYLPTSLGHFVQAHVGIHIPAPWSIWDTVAIKTKKRKILNLYPIGSMYAIYGNIYHPYIPKVGICTIHGSYGYLYNVYIYIYVHMYICIHLCCFQMYVC